MFSSTEVEFTDRDDVCNAFYVLAVAAKQGGKEHFEAREALNALLNSYFTGGAIGSLRDTSKSALDIFPAEIDWLTREPIAGLLPFVMQTIQTQEVWHPDGRVIDSLAAHALMEGLGVAIHAAFCSEFIKGAVKAGVMFPPAPKRRDLRVTY